MSQNTTKPLTLDDIRARAREDAIALIKDCGGLNKAADSIGMGRGRLSFISRGVWTQVAVNEIDLARLATGRMMMEKDLSLTVEARELSGQLQKQLTDVHDTVARLLKVMRKL